MEATAPAPQDPQQQQAEQPTSLGYLQLQDAFKRMVAVGVDVVDEQVGRSCCVGAPAERGGARARAGGAPKRAGRQRIPTRSSAARLQPPSQPRPDLHINLANCHSLHRSPAHANALANKRHANHPPCKPPPHAQAFYRTMAGVPDHLLWPLWQLYIRVVAGVVDNAMSEFEDVAREAALQQQLADLEALALQRGRALGAAEGSRCGLARCARARAYRGVMRPGRCRCICRSGNFVVGRRFSSAHTPPPENSPSDDPAAGPAAAAAAARVAAKRAEKQQLQEALAKVGRWRVGRSAGGLD
jgi:hypothetical protein